MSSGPVSTEAPARDDRASVVAPCGCSGTCAYVHPRCLETWVLRKGLAHCEVCKKKYSLAMLTRRAQQRLAVPEHPDSRETARADHDAEPEFTRQELDEARAFRERMAAESERRRLVTEREARRREQQRQAEVVEEVRRRAAEVAAELERASAASAQPEQQGARPASARPASASSSRPCYYISSTGGGSCYHLSPTCSSLRRNGAVRASSTDGRRLCQICERGFAIPVTPAPESPRPPSSATPARRTYYTTRTGKKYHIDRCCFGLRSAHRLFEASSRPAGLEPCNVCCGGRDA